MYAYVNSRRNTKVKNFMHESQARSFKKLLHGNRKFCREKQMLHCKKGETVRGKIAKAVYMNLKQLDLYLDYPSHNSKILQ